MKEQSSDDRTWKGERRAREINWRRNAIRVVWQEKIGSVLWEPNKGRKDSLTLEKVKVRVTSLSRVRLFATPWTVVYQAPPSMGFPRQEYWSGVPSPSLTYHRLWSPKAKLKSRSGPLPRTPPHFKFDLLLSNCSSALGSWP